MKIAARVLRYAALAWFLAALFVALFGDGASRLPAAIVAALAPIALVVVATMIDPHGPHRPDPGDARPDPI